MTIDKKSASISLAAGLALALVAGSGSAASAKEVTVVGKPIPADALTEIVSVADLNLASAYGAKTLKYRVRGAVGNVCKPLDLRESIIEHGYCRSFAWSEARPQMERAILRAQQLAANGTTSIAPVAIVISAPQR